jgi:hypothetical protein
MRRGWWVLVAAASWPISAAAEEKARLVYVRGNGADDCPAEVDLRLWVMARLGYDPFSPQASRVVISRVEARGDRLVSNLEVIDQGGKPTGQRELKAAPGHCGELARALALSISLAIDPDRASHPSTAAPVDRPPEATDSPAEGAAEGASEARPNWYWSKLFLGVLHRTASTAYPTAAILSHHPTVPSVVFLKACEYRDFVAGGASALRPNAARR